ncbi:helix-turn-helix domain containing protein [Desmospora activa]|uniref:Uncharacterized protein n=1 Tax=Desmospora activa DSM 45169 TaxID=1121389 RepID=A0A2T4Z8Z7_9BACL|nr:helix-turn-helix domain containing protein [Desmospora activa]PTM58358.1 hypothetical protein C8J48_0940 [Desmospora activa DSM 45169]
MGERMSNATAYKGRRDYIACDDLDFGWTQQELHIFREMWEKGKPGYEIAKTLKRSRDEIGILIIDQTRQGMISPRKGGWFGIETRGETI